MRHDVLRIWPRQVRVGLVVVTAAGVAAAGVVTSVWNARASADAAPRSAFVPIQDVAPNVRRRRSDRPARPGCSLWTVAPTATGKLSPDNPVAQPGVKNGAQHVHDFVGNLSITADSSDASLDDSDTTCRNGDKSSYFWPVVRIDQTGQRRRPAGPSPGTRRRSVCPSVGDRLPAVPRRPRAEVDQNLATAGPADRRGEPADGRQPGPGRPGLRQQRRSSGRCAASGSPPWTGIAIAIGRQRYPTHRPGVAGRLRCQLRRHARRMHRHRPPVPARQGRRR